jgi:hypothetical protein
MTEQRYRCPNCDTRIIDRRLAQCEGCGKDIPSDRLYTKEQLAALESEIKRRQRARQRALDERRSRRSDDVDVNCISGGDGGDGGCD